MERLESIINYLAVYKTGKIREKIINMKACSEETLMLHVRATLETAINVQKQQPWEPVCLCLFHLLSSIVTGSYKYQILLANEQLYLDELQVAQEWKADFFYQDEREMVKKELQKEFIRLSEYEIIYANHWMQYEYRSLMELYWRKKVEEISKLEEFQQIKKSQLFRFFYGDYMGALRLVSAYKGEE